MQERALPETQEQHKRAPWRAWPRRLLETLTSDWRGTRLLCSGLLLLVVALLLVAAFYLNHPGLDTDPDTATYEVVSQRILSSGDPVDPVRTPGYPLLIALIWLLSGSRDLGLVSLAQGGLFVLATLEIYLLAWLIWRRAWLGLLVGLIVASDMYLLSYVKALIVEPLSLWLAASLALAAVWYTRRVSARRLWLVAALLLAALMTRPEWVYLPVLLLGYLLFIAARRQRFRRLLPHALAAVVVLYGLVGLYVYENTVQYGYTGITELQNANLLGKILEYDMQDEAPPQYAPVMKAADAFLAGPEGPTRNPNLLARAYPALSQDHWALAGSYAVAIIKAHPLEYLLKSLPAVYTLPLGYHAYSPLAVNGPFGWGLYQLLRVSRWLYYVEWSFIFWALAWVALFCWRRATRLPAVEAMSAVLLIVLYQLFLDSVGAYVDLRRFRAPIEPLLLLVIWGSLFAALAWGWRWYQERRKKKEASRAA
jgi:hypothetical protein